MDTLSEAYTIVPGEDRDDEIARLYNQGKTPVEIARQFGWNSNRVTRRIQACRKYGLIEGHSPRYIREQQNAEVEILLNAKTPEEEVAKWLGISREEARKRIISVRGNIRRRQRREALRNGGGTL